MIISSRRRKFFLSKVFVFVFVLAFFGGVYFFSFNSFAVVDLDNEEVDYQWIKEQIQPELDKIDFCNSYEDEVFRYYCFMNHGLSSEIENPYLNYFATRLSYRPHMIPLFATGLNEVGYDDGLGVCDSYEGVYLPICLFMHAVDLSSNGLSGAVDFCKSIDDVDIMGECLYYSAVPLFLRLKEGDVRNNFLFLNNFCGEIESDFSSKECFYSIADQLVAYIDYDEINPDDLCLKESISGMACFFDSINEICSNAFATCLHHITPMLNDDSLERELCNSIEVREFKIDCIRSVGEGVNKLDIFNFSKTFAKEDRPFLLIGFSEFITDKSICDQFKGDTKVGCLFGFYHAEFDNLNNISYLDNFKDLFSGLEDGKFKRELSDFTSRYFELEYSRQILSG